MLLSTAQGQPESWASTDSAEQVHQPLCRPATASQGWAVHPLQAAQGSPARHPAWGAICRGLQAG